MQFLPFHAPASFSFRILIILSLQFKITLRMMTGRTDLRRSCSHRNVAAVSALPDFYFTLPEYLF